MPVQKREKKDIKNWCQFIAQKRWKWIEIVEGPFFVREDLLLKFLTKNRKFKEDGGHGVAGTRV